MDTLYEDPEAQRRAIEFKLRRELIASGKPLPSPNLEAFEKAKNEALDWRGTCAQCGHNRIGSLDFIRTPCANCGYGHVMEAKVREEGS